MGEAPLQPPAEPDAAQVVSGSEGGAPSNLVTLPWGATFMARMFREIEAAEKRRADQIKEWDVLVNDYIPEVTKSGTPEAVKSQSHFRNVHTKLASTFYQFPELYLEALGPLKDPIGINPIDGRPITAEDAVVIKRQVLNKKLGDDGVDISRMMDECLLDCFMWSGIASVKVGHRVVMKTVQEPVRIPDPNFVPPPPPIGSVLGLAAPSVVPPQVPLIGDDGAPVMRSQEVPIFEEWYARRFSAKKLLMSADLRSSRPDEDSCMMGMDFFMTGAQIKASFGFEPEGTAAATDDLVAGDKKVDETDKKYHGYELWLKACEYDPAQPHPQAIHQLVLLKDVKDRPLVYRPSPDQTFDDMGKLTVDSLVGFPIEVCFLRDMPDSPYIKADSAFTNSQVKQIDTHRRQSVKLRDAAIPKMLYDESAFTPEEVLRMKDMKIGDWMAVQEGKLAGGADKILAAATQPVNGRDDYRLAAMLKQDMEETLGIDAAAAGVQDTSGAKTATEVNTANTKGMARIGKDRQRAVKFFLKVVRKYDALLMRYATNEEYIHIVGLNGVRRLVAWNNKVISGPYAYNIKLDSQLMMDAARDRQQLTNFYEKTAADPRVNQLPILKKLAGLYGLDPTEVIQDPALANIAGQGLPIPIPGAPTSQPTAAPPGPRPVPGPGPTAAPSGTRPHVETGARPNQPEIGQAPNVARPA